MMPEEMMGDGPADPFLNPAVLPLVDSAYDMYAAFIAKGCPEERAERFTIAFTTVFLAQALQKGN
jgi:hypothetical protein